ncbi:alpha-1,2-fucosyltransferase [Vibrio parahaemolyticus]|uniref:Putative fucosyltransferase n=1 Tax=Vibrio parahaemolyticus TaxID=670 RepID=A0A5Q5AX86_VIBPH|nr:alpha-1,2-fucosyltransferase [Vibrio parahaemolyticus]EGQ8481389.1 alpha-1,2-fucosyltransferase [Vibrio parahaemolyticus]EGR1280596.1 alpha-1,2-fucosyltransferase [Vibrio parahaemolyticus]EGR1790056.1 alpha-1,2-fucosyltransferase [Vibrio parahaemolyticus]EGR1936183.1 alpha-1,2-fucosyltransferase [Vibrio parahaemolyticus]EGR3456661.1 alpha-1,2-fucosyltransferase [Vibrio parahaemolyticus]
MFTGKNTIRVKIIGGLGNQMFQYAAAFAYSRIHNKELVIDVRNFDNYEVHPLRLNKLNVYGEFDSRKRNIIYKAISKLADIIKPECVYHEKCISYDEKFHDYEYNFINGYFQSEKYFSAFRSELLDMFTLRENLSKYQLEIKNKIESNNTVSLHVRRGDYVDNKNANDTHGICSKSYFLAAIDYMKDGGVINEKTKLVVFSDDIDWCIEHIRFDLDTIFVKGDDECPEKDMYLMSLCEHNIISNSTFSWWGAWLNNNDNKMVIAPSKWFKDPTLSSKDIIPTSWAKI